MSRGRDAFANETRFFPVVRGRIRIGNADTIRVMFKGLEHTAIASPNPQKLAQWYVDHLEFRINYEYDGNYFVRAQNGTVLEIIQSVGTRSEQKMKDPGIR